MRKFLVVAAVATLFGTAAFAEEGEDVAQSYNPDFGTGNVLPAPDSGVSGALDARAQAPAVRRKHSRALRNGETDPDPNIRFQLRREQQEDVSGD